MRKEWVEKSKTGALTYCVSNDGGEARIPVTWTSPEDYLADMEQATQAAFGVAVTDLGAELKDRESAVKFQDAWFEVIKAKMRRP